MSNLAIPPWLPHHDTRPIMKWMMSSQTSMSAGYPPGMSPVPSSHVDQLSVVPSSIMMFESGFQPPPSYAPSQRPLPTTSIV